jgi:hypothetical protein
MSDSSANAPASNPKSVGAPKDSTLQALSTIVVQMERQLGPLIDLGHGPLLQADGTSSGQDVTVLTFDMAQEPPAKNATLQQCIGSNVPVVGGSALIKTGQCYVSGQLIMLAAFRPQ